MAHTSVKVVKGLSWAGLCVRRAASIGQRCWMWKPAHFCHTSPECRIPDGLLCQGSLLSPFLHLEFQRPNWIHGAPLLHHLRIHFSFLSFTFFPLSFSILFPLPPLPHEITVIEYTAQ
jgi:hypothetical protein